MTKLFLILASLLLVMGAKAATITNWGMQLPTTSPNGGDVILMQQGGITYYFTPNQLAVFMSTNQLIASQANLTSMSNVFVGYIDNHDLTITIMQVVDGDLQGATNKLNTGVANLIGATNGLDARVASLVGATNGIRTDVLNLQGGTNGLLARVVNLDGATNGIRTDVLNLQAVTNSIGGVAGPISSVQVNSNGVRQGSANFVFTNDFVGVGPLVIPTASIHIANSNDMGTAQLRLENLAQPSSVWDLAVDSNPETTVLGLRRNSSYLVTFEPAGNVGFGTTNPANRVDVEGRMAIGAAFSGSSIAPTDGLVVEGYVGVGTGTPADKLSVTFLDTNIYSSTANVGEGLILANTNSSAFDGTFSTIEMSATANGAQTAIGIINLIQPTATSRASDLAIQLRTAANTYIEVMRLKSDGMTGIGTASPLGRLHVVGGIVQTNGGIWQNFSIDAPAAPAANTQGAVYWNDGTNVCVVFRNAAGTLTTNKLSMTAWP